MLSPQALWRVLREAAGQWVDDHAPSMGAALSYYAMFSLSPLLLIVVSVAGLAFGAEAARGEIMDQLGGLIGTPSARMIEELLQGANRPAAGVAGTVIGVVVLLIGATTVFAELQDAMDRIWRAPPSPGSGGLMGLLRVRLLSLGMVLGLGFLLIVSLVVSAALAALGRWWQSWFGEGWLRLAEGLNFGVSLLCLTAMFAMIYKWLPRVRLAWRDVLVGAAMTSLLFTLGKSLIGYYIGHSGIASSFGAAASLAVLLLWVYYSAQIFLLGAEFTRVFACRHGSLRHRGAPLAVPAVAH
jgi:membrane protein